VDSAIQDVVEGMRRRTEEEFGMAMDRVLSPSRAIETPELLKGRDTQLAEIRKAWYQAGRQVFIHGYRGVGKTSLAMTAAFQHQSLGAHLGCDGRPETP
jgi:uncharacterized protein